MSWSRIRRYAWAAKQIAGANVHRLASPLKVNFAVTYWCQYRCQTCNIWQRRPENELSTDEVLRFFGQNDRISWLDITGGEIFLRQDVEDILDAALALPRLVLLHFPTNGFLTDRIARVCERLAARRRATIIVTVSIDGDEELNDRVRGIKGGYRRQVETFNALRGIPGIRPVFGMTLSQFNAGAFARTFRACQRDCPGLSISDFHLNVAQLSNHYYGNDASANVVPAVEASLSEIAEYQSRRGASRTLADWVESVYLQHLRAYLQTGELPMRCHALRSSCFIDPWGTVFPCITYSRPIGSLRETDMALTPLWSAVDAKRLQGEIWEGHCPQCWTACEAYQSVLGNLLQVRGLPPRVRPRLLPLSVDVGSPKRLTDPGVNGHESV